MSSLTVKQIGKYRFQIEAVNTWHDTRFYVKGDQMRLILTEADLFDLIQQFKARLYRPATSGLEVIKGDNDE